MRRVLLPAITIAIGLLAALGGRAIFVQDKYTVQVPDGLAFSEFRGDKGVRVHTIVAAKDYVFTAYPKR